MFATFKIGIFGATRERALIAFESCINKIEPSKIKYVRKSSFGNIECMLFDGTLIRAVVASENARGSKFDRIIYDDEIDREILDCIVRPCLVTPIWSFARAGLDL